MSFPNHTSIRSREFLQMAQLSQRGGGSGQSVSVLGFQSGGVVASVQWLVMLYSQRTWLAVFVQQI